MTAESKEHYDQIKRILILVLLFNWLVALAKIIYGWLSRCASMTADGFHSLSDGASNIIGLTGITIASQPKDSDHPYGHKKYETFASLGIAVLLFLIAFNLIEEGLRRIFQPIVPRVDTVSFLVMLSTLTVNLAVMRYEYKKGVLLKSDILVSDSQHTKADILTSLSVILTLILIKLGLPMLDPLATIIIALFIAASGYGIIRKSSKVLCDTRAVVEVKKITQIVLGVKGVQACHKIRSRGRADDIHIDLHVQVHPSMHIDQAHEISYAIEEVIKKNIPGITDVVVHLEPRG